MGYAEKLGGFYNHMLDLELRDNSRLKELNARLNADPNIIWTFLISERERGE